MNLNLIEVRTKLGQDVYRRVTINLANIEKLTEQTNGGCFITLINGSVTTVESYEQITNLLTQMVDKRKE